MNSHVIIWRGQKRMLDSQSWMESKATWTPGAKLIPTRGASILNLWAISAALHKALQTPMSGQLIFYCHVTFSQPQSLSNWSKPFGSAPGLLSAQFWSITRVGWEDTLQDVNWSTDSDFSDLLLLILWILEDDQEAWNCRFCLPENESTGLKATWQ